MKAKFSLLAAVSAVLCTASIASTAAQLPSSHDVFASGALTTIDRSADDMLLSRRGRGADDGADHQRRGRGADDGASHARRGRGADDGAGHQRRGRGADDGANHARRGRGADDGAGHQRRGRGADDGANHA